MGRRLTPMPRVYISYAFRAGLDRFNQMDFRRARIHPTRAQGDVKTTGSSNASGLPGEHIRKKTTTMRVWTPIYERQ